MTSSSHHKVVCPSGFAGNSMQDVSITAEDGLTLSAWLIPDSKDNAVITLSGIKRDRLEMYATAKAYAEWGFTVLMPDLRGTGQSQGVLVSMGYYERKDVVACARWLQSKGYKRIGVHGMSMGAATACFTMKELPDVGFYVVESSFDTMQHAIDQRLDMVYLPHFIAWPFKKILGYRLGVSMDDLSPLDHVSFCKCPTLFLAGDSEGFLTIENVTEMLNRCGAEKKQMHIYTGGQHRTSMDAFPDEAHRVIRDFLVDKAGYVIF